ncbi:MarR family transcriptional regulator [Paenalcaligenes niemegkensis]|uniref:MarR family winged helix-turn-helix transcriptional regulator n=1 Tax=Paenalcaligenes niemegkensis TaxID=2895469 RepID=UPI001EE83F4C|nr:MarR family transcriptional regulator [Paenalcaligenes niemegkensis]MCQ9615843.1 MarR family transcriptional regulator [Paenalcaligenes niemegkensis]
MASHNSFSARERFGVQFVELARRWRRALDHSLAQTGLTDATWAPLIRLHELGDGVQQKELALRVGLRESSLVRLLDILEQGALIERRADEADRRAKLIFITPAGRNSVAKIRKVLAHVETDILVDLSDQEIESMLQAFANIGKRIQPILDDSEQRS